MFERAGISTREIGLLVVGATAGMMMNIPIIVFGNYLLAINIGGALIPVAVSVYFLSKKKIDLTLTFSGIALISIFITLIVISTVHPFALPEGMQRIFFGMAASLFQLKIILENYASSLGIDYLSFATILISIPLLLFVSLFSRVSKSFCAVISFLCISIITLLVTKYIPNVGILADIPYAFYPTFLGSAFALAVYGRDVVKGGPFAYAITTFGNLLGADLYHLPELFTGKGFVGSVGGAGIYDLVFISGLFAMCIVFLFSPYSLRTVLRTFTQEEIYERGIRKNLYEAEIHLRYGKFIETIQCSFNAVIEKINSIGVKYKIKDDYNAILNIIGIDPITRYNFDMLKKETENKFPTYADAYRAKIASEYLINHLQEKEKEIYAFTYQRIMAFLIDLPIIITIILSLFYLGIYYGIYKAEDVFSFPPNNVWTLAWMWWAWATQMVYFTFFEGIFGFTPGKKIVGILVLNENLTKLDLMGAFTRNAVRFVDIFIFFYLVSVLLIIIKKKKVRIGDIVAKTVVVRVV